MSKKLEERKELFLEKSNRLFNNRFEYDLSNFKSLDSLITIKEKSTGHIFKQTGRNHLRNRNGGIPDEKFKSNSNLGYTKEDVIIKIEEIFGKDHFEFLTPYKGFKETITVKCLIHKEIFETTPASLYRGHNSCPAYYHELLSEKSASRKLNKSSDVDKLRNLVLSGKTFEEIGESLGISGHQVGVLCKKYGIEKPNPIQDKIDSLRKIFSDGKTTLTEASIITGMSIQAISYICKQYDIDYYVKNNDIDLAELRKLVLDGNSCTDIALSTGYSVNTVRYAVHNQLGIKITDLRKEDRKEKSKIISDLSDMGYTNSEISRELDISVSSVVGIQEEFGLDNRFVAPKFNYDDNLDDILKCIKDGLSNPEIANIYNITDDTLHHALERRGIKNPNHLLSLGELLVNNYLVKNNITILEKTKIFGIQGRNLDYVVPDFRVIIDGFETWIEYNGQQHYEFIEHFHSKNCHDSFENQLKRDRNVREYCKNNNIILIEIPYIINTEEGIKDFLDKTLLQGIDPNTLVDYNKLYKLD